MYWVDKPQWHLGPNFYILDTLVKNGDKFSATQVKHYEFITCLMMPQQASPILYRFLRRLIIDRFIFPLHRGTTTRGDTLLKKLRFIDPTTPIGMYYAAHCSYFD